jgi:hypothetical protein
MSQPLISIIYSYYEKNEQYRTNLIYFLKKGYYRDPQIDYTIVINGSHTINFPKEPNLKVIQRENTGFDFQGYYVGLISLKKEKPPTYRLISVGTQPSSNSYMIQSN